MKIADDFAAIAAGVKKLHEPGTRKVEAPVTLSISAVDGASVMKLLRERTEKRAREAAAKAYIDVGAFAPPELAGCAAATAYGAMMTVSNAIADEMRAFFGCDGE